MFVSAEKYLQVEKFCGEDLLVLEVLRVKKFWPRKFVSAEKIFTNRKFLWRKFVDGKFASAEKYLQVESLFVGGSSSAESLPPAESFSSEEVLRQKFVLAES